MSKRKDGVFSLLRQILAEQKKQTKILQAIESSKEPYIDPLTGRELAFKPLLHPHSVEYRWLKEDALKKRNNEN